MAVTQPNELVATGGRESSSAGEGSARPTVNKFRRFRQIVRRTGDRNEKAESAVAGELGDSYFCYYFYGIRRRS